MWKLRRRDFIKSGLMSLATAGKLGPTAISQASSPGPDAESQKFTPSNLYETFKDPPREYTIYPFWFWNGKLDPEEVNWQIKEFVDKGIYGAFMDPRRGLQTPYLSEEWWSVVGRGLKRSKELGFYFDFHEEYGWPDGEARDIWLNKKEIYSRVIAQNYNFRQRRLAYVERRATGPTRLTMGDLKDAECAVATRWLGGGRIEADSLVDISAQLRDQTLTWEVPPGEWLVMVFYREWSEGLDEGQVDLLNPEAVKTYINLFYEEFYRRFPDSFGNTITIAFADHEGDYGRRIAWTPNLFDVFRQMKGYDLPKHLPLLVYDGGKFTEKLRCDYLDVISELYATAFFKQVSDWCEAHRIKLTGHIWEQSLQSNVALQGDLFRIQRSWSIPGIDSLVDWWNSPRDFIETRSVAHFRGTRFFCENQGVQGATSYLDPQEMRRGTNMIAAWGVNLFCPHGFNYDRDRINFPQDWFYHQPFWPYMKHYADYSRRISFMNHGGRHVAEIVIYYPLETSWALSSPIFAEHEVDYRLDAIDNRWPNALQQIDQIYQQLKDLLADEGWDYDIVDYYYLNKAVIKDRRLSLAQEAYSVLILPPLTTIRREALEKIRQFFNEGGTVLALHQLPTNSMEEGRNDPHIHQQIQSLFGSANPSGGSSPLKTNARGGNVYFLKGSLDGVTQILSHLLKKDAQVVRGDPRRFYYIHWIKENHHVYWVVNNTGNPRGLTVRFSVEGAPERWDALTDEREPLFYQNVSGATEVHLTFGPWDAYYVVFAPSNKKFQTASLIETNIADYYVSNQMPDRITLQGRVPPSVPEYHAELREGGQTFLGRGTVKNVADPVWLSPEGWVFTLESERISLPFARVQLDPENLGEKSGWHLPDYNDRFWSEEWLSYERLTAREWWLLGPFDNKDHRGYGIAYPPETEVDLKRTYEGAGGQQLHWVRYDSPERYIDLDRALGLQKGQPATCYAFSYIYSPEAKAVQLRVTPDNNFKAWLNGKPVFAVHDHHGYQEMRDAFAYVFDADLRQGWNSILLKISEAGRTSSGIYGFLFRVADTQKRNLSEIIYSAAELSREQLKTRQQPPPASGSRWYRWHISPAMHGVELWGPRYPYVTYLNGQRLAASSTNSGHLTFPQLNPTRRNVFAMRVNPNDVIPDAVQFMTGPTEITLSSWTFMDGLSHYSGRATYEKSFTLPASFQDKQWVLDCGEVGSTAEVWVNDKYVGVRLWLPYTFDLTPYVRGGENHLKIRVANTMSNARAVQSASELGRRVGWQNQLQRIDKNGLLGPVRIVPWTRVQLVCPKQSA